MEHDEEGIRSTTRGLLIALMVAGWLLLVPAFGHSAGNKQPDAQPAQPDSQPAASPGSAKTGAVAINDKDDYQGDKVSFAVTLAGDMLSKNCSKGRIPAGVTLVGQGREVDSADSNKLNYLFTIKCRRDSWYKAPTITNCTGYDKEQVDVDKDGRCVSGLCDCDGKSLWSKEAQAFREGEIISIPATTLEKFKPNRYGLAYGLLAVPFKFELTGKKEVKGSATLGSYVGYRLDREGTAGYAISGVIFAGAANVSGSKTRTTQDSTSNAATTTGGTTTTKTSDTNLFAFSYGVGLLGVIKDGFQIGAVLGFDHADSGQGFKYNDKPWLAFQIGYEFSLPQ